MAVREAEGVSAACFMLRVSSLKSAGHAQGPDAFPGQLSYRMEAGAQPRRLVTRGMVTLVEGMWAWGSRGTPMS